MMKIFLDENLSEHVADALNSLNIGYFQGIDVVSTKKEIGTGKADSEIIPVIGEENGILVTQDNDFRKESAIYGLCKKYNLGVIFLAPANGLNRHWDLVKLLIKNWEELIKLCNSRRPFAYRITTRGGLKKL